MTDTILRPEEARARLIPRSAYAACSVAFIDCKKPGSHLKKNYSMIGPGVTTSLDQVINIREPHGFNVGAASMPKGITNNLHIHFTAEVFFVFGGDYLFRWGDDGKDGEIVGSDGDVISVPTWIFRGFTNIGADDAMIFTALGGDDTGGIIWHPSILRDAAEHGLYLTRDNILVDTSNGATKPPDGELLEPIGAADIATLRRWSVDEMRQRVVKTAERRWSRQPLLDSCLPGHACEIAPVIGHGICQDRTVQAPVQNPHGFSVEWLRLAPGQSVSPFRIDGKQVCLAHNGAFTVTLNHGESAEPLPLRAWDMISIPGGVWRSIANASDTTSELLMITSGEGPKRPVFRDDVVRAARDAGVAVDASGLLAPARLLPNYAIGRQSNGR